MTIQKFLDVEQAMQDPAWQDTKLMAEELDRLKAELQTAMTAIQRIYDPILNQWNAWCLTNLQAGEMNLIKNIYTKSNVLFDGMA